MYLSLFLPPRPPGLFVPWTIRTIVDQAYSYNFEFTLVRELSRKKSPNLQLAVEESGTIEKMKNSLHFLSVFRKKIPIADKM